MIAIASTLPARMGGVTLATEPGPFAAGEGTSARDFRLRREEETLAGRRCAARALARAGGGLGSEVREGPLGRPEWPRGFSGSIAHAPGCCISIAASADRWAELGVDCEIHHSMMAEEQELVLTASEKTQIAWLYAGAIRKLHWDIIFFCIKEAVFKAVSVRDPELFEFADVEARVLTHGAFTARCKTAVGATLVGCFGLINRHIVAVAGSPVCGLGSAAGQIANFQ